MSAYHCCVPLCTNDSRYDEKNLLSFHRFPSDNELRKEWILKIRRDIGRNFQITNNALVCSAHFEDADIKKTLAGKRKLILGAVPTKFAWTKTPAKRLGPQRRSVVKIEKGEGENVMASTSASNEHDCVQIPLATFDHDYVVQQESDSSKLESAQAELKRLEQENIALKEAKFGLERFHNDDNMINFYTGFKDYQTLTAVFSALKPTAMTMIRWTQMQRQGADLEKVKKITFSFESHHLSLIDEFFVFLCRIRQGFPEQDLAVRFCVSQTSISRILITWSNYLYAMLGSLPLWPSRTVVNRNMPESFRLTYPFTRVILDCTEIKVQTPSSKVLNSQIYSNYKSHTTFKGLVGITPCGTVSFVSSLYTGGISDKDITARSGILDLLEEYDDVMADKGFLISDLLQAKNAGLVIPPFLGAKGKFSRIEVTTTHEIARLRIHVERAIRRIKEYHIFDGVIPLNLAPSINQIWTVCVILTNFRGALF
ncbi:uncharacterized protein LOC134247604 [Saccostrea cucullata]|uniref:uncharacterized protein LOC134247604 n=1 Tax=Saccostrea cuccullata TaxID=36930 RepID=UPI002ED06298